MSFGRGPDDSARGCVHGLVVGFTDGDYARVSVIVRKVEIFNILAVINVLEDIRGVRVDEIGIDCKDGLLKPFESSSVKVCAGLQELDRQERGQRI